MLCDSIKWTDPINRASVDAIEKSLFAVCLDQPVADVDPNDDLNVAGSQLIHGGGSKLNSGNRWFNKTLELVVNRNGMNGINYEHSPAEGRHRALVILALANESNSSQHFE